MLTSVSVMKVVWCWAQRLIKWLYSDDAGCYDGGVYQRLMMLTVMKVVFLRGWCWQLLVLWWWCGVTYLGRAQVTHTVSSYPRMLVKLARVAFLHYEQWSTQWRKDLRTHLKTQSGENMLVLSKGSACCFLQLWWYSGTVYVLYVCAMFLFLQCLSR